MLLKNNSLNFTRVERPARSTTASNRTQLHLLKDCRRFPHQYYRPWLKPRSWWMQESNQVFFSGSWEGWGPQGKEPPWMRPRSSWLLYDSVFPSGITSAQGCLGQNHCRMRLIPLPSETSWAFPVSSSWEKSFQNWIASDRNHHDAWLLGFFHNLEVYSCKQWEPLLHSHHLWPRDPDLLSKLEGLLHLSAWFLLWSIPSV